MPPALVLMVEAASAACSDCGARACVDGNEGLPRWGWRVWAAASLATCGDGSARAWAMLTVCLDSGSGSMRGWQWPRRRAATAARGRGRWQQCALTGMAVAWLGSSGLSGLRQRWRVCMCGRRQHHA